MKEKTIEREGRVGKKEKQKKPRAGKTKAHCLKRHPYLSGTALASFMATYNICPTCLLAHALQIGFEFYCIF